MTSRFGRAGQLILGVLANLPPAAWVMSAFVVNHLVFFVLPVFLNPDHVMQFFRYVPYTEPIGLDLSLPLAYSRAWLEGGNPYAGDAFYPPLTWLLFAPLTTLAPTTAFAALTGITLVCYLMLVTAIPIWMSTKSPPTWALVLVLATGLTSYGLQFELERGQFSIISIALCFAAAGLFHLKPRLRLLAYLLFSLSIQLKIFPAIFVFMFIESGSDWRVNLKRLLGLVLTNTAALFILGPHIFLDFIGALGQHTAEGLAWHGNHSIASWIETGIDALTGRYPSVAGWLPRPMAPAVGLLLALVLLLLAFIAARAYRRPQSEPNAYLLMACTLCALLIPSISNDYKLAMLAGPFVLLLGLEVRTQQGSGQTQLGGSILLLALSLLYFSTLYSYIYKPALLRNNAPALLLMLVLTAVLAAKRAEPETAGGPLPVPE